MNNKEKREYISCLHLMENINLCHPEEMVRIRKVLSNCPETFYKYKKFDKWTFDIIEKKYAYLSQVKDLDDPFDCLSDFDTSKIMSTENKTISKMFLKHIIKESKTQLTKRQHEIVEECVSAFKPGDDFETDRIYNALKDEGIPDNIINEQILCYKNLVNLSDTYNDNGTFEPFLQILKDPGKNIGVCALSEINDNKVLWSLYGKRYKGFCIEYSIKPTQSARRFLFPVIYSRKPNNNFTEKLFDTAYAEMNRQIVNRLFLLNSQIPSVGAIYELFCTKDIDWAYQKEWRIIGKGDSHFTEVDIKAVYLGFDVAKTNEAKMIRCAKKYGFDLYKMKAPDGKKKIRFYKIG